MPASYQQNLQWFGNPQAYAEEIKRKEATGQAFSDPASAAAFRRDYANLFAQPGGTAVPMPATAPATTTNRPMAAAPTTTPSGVPMGGGGGAPAPWLYSPEQMQQQAQRLAGLQINPQREALNRSLEQAMANAEAQRGSIMAAYQGVPQQLQTAAAEAQRKAQESAIARGVGRSGVVDWQSSKINEEMTRQLSQSEAAKAAQLAAIANQLGLTQQQAQAQLGQLATREGELAAAYIPQAEEAQFGRQMQVLPYERMTEYQRQQLPLGYAQTFGQMPQGYPTGSGAPLYPSATTAQPAQAQPATGGLDLNNERLYLQNLIQSGNPGQAAWARQQAALYAQQYPGFQLGV